MPLLGRADHAAAGPPGPDRDRPSLQRALGDGRDPQGSGMRRSLKLNGEDVVDLAEYVERVFDVGFLDEELARCETVGDVEDLLIRRFEGDKRSRGLCHSAIAFRRVRRVAQTFLGAARISPRTLPAAYPAINPRELARRLNAESGLDYRYPRSWMTGLAWSFGVAGVLAGVWGLLGTDWIAGDSAANAFFSALLIVAGLLLGALMRWHDPGRFPEDMTFGDVAREVAPGNFGKLVGLGGDVRAERIRSLIRAMCSDASRVPADEIGRGTRLYLELVR